jgi:hypothetical protein
MKIEAVGEKAYGQKVNNLGEINDEKTSCKKKEDEQRKNRIHESNALARSGHMG